jgi:hypothetical protein
MSNESEELKSISSFIAPMDEDYISSPQNAFQYSSRRHHQGPVLQHSTLVFSNRTMRNVRRVPVEKMANYNHLPLNHYLDVDWHLRAPESSKARRGFKRGSIFAWAVIH